jgi:hypothetical protein
VGLAAFFTCLSNFDSIKHIAGVTHEPQEHCEPPQFQLPNLALHALFGQTNVPSYSGIEPIHSAGSERKRDEQFFVPTSDR